jgi:hypothetical protein
MLVLWEEPEAGQEADRRAERVHLRRLHAPLHTVLAAPGRTVSTPIARIEQVGDEPGAGPCSFCAKPRNRVAAMASARTTRICNECLGLCDEIVREELGESD